MGKTFVLLILLLGTNIFSAPQAVAKNEQVKEQKVSDSAFSVDNFEADRKSIRHELEIIRKELLILQVRFEETKNHHQIKNQTFRESSKELATLKSDVRHIESSLTQLKINSSEFAKLVSKVAEEKESSNMPALVLGAATLVITGLSISIAILAIWGYQNIKKAAAVEALKDSEQRIIDAISNGEFNETIYLAVEKAIYRDILSSSDFPEAEEGNNESM